MNRIIAIASGIASCALITDPALAGRVATTPAPVAGLGIGAAALIGMGYRALKGRSTK